MKQIQHLMLLAVCATTVLCAQEKQFYIIIPSYNNIKWYQRNLDMLFAQDQHHNNWHAIYIDDHSTDGTGPAVEHYVHEHHFDHKVTVIKNEQNRGALANLYFAIHSCPNDAIILTYDGDDWFYDEHVLEYLNSIYQDPNVWLTYGQYVEYPSGNLGICAPFPENVVKKSSYRKETWVSSHLRTFYAGLFKNIKQEDLMWEGTFFPMTWDLAIMFPMLEMAGHHVRFIDRILYVYNLDNPINDWKKNLTLMYQLNNYIRKKPKYAALS